VTKMATRPERQKVDVPPTFSMVACNLAEGEWGVGVQSKFLAVGSVVPWARAGVGAVATQSFANPQYGPLGLALLEKGLSAEEVVRTLVAQDEGRALRQVGVIDKAGMAAAYTGKSCQEWAGEVIGERFSCQGNILTGPEVVQAMAQAFARTGGQKLAERLIAALEAGQSAGGDRRGQQSAALFVVKERGGFGGMTDRYIDLRVDDHPEPIAELRRLLSLHREVWR
jgi:uncharacterized Ntn-hydrolase superfamily protein